MSPSCFVSVLNLGPKVWGPYNEGTRFVSYSPLVRQFTKVSRVPGLPLFVVVPRRSGSETSHFWGVLWVPFNHDRRVSVRGLTVTLVGYLFRYSLYRDPVYHSRLPWGLVSSSLVRNRRNLPGFPPSEVCRHWKFSLSSVNHPPPPTILPPPVHTHECLKRPRGTFYFYTRRIRLNNS